MNGKLAWDLYPRRSLFDREIDVLGDLRNLLEYVKIDEKEVMIVRVVR